MPLTVRPYDDLARLAAAAEYLVDERVGIVESVREVRTDAGAPRFFHYAARAANTDAFTRQRNFANGGGAATTRERAIAKAIGEAVERYCSAIYDIEELPLATYAEAGFPALDPHELALYAPEQYAREGFPWVPFEHDTPVRWAPARDLTEDCERFVPAARVMMPYTYYLGTGDAPVDQPISTGMACHVDYHRAALSGVCEVVERDAVMLTWQAMLARPQIRVETLDDEGYELVQRIERAGLRVVMLDLAMDHGIPSILSCIVGDGPALPALVVAGASSPSPADAVRKSLEELVHSLRYCQFVKSTLPPIETAPPDWDGVTDQLTHLGFWADPARSELSEFLFSSRERREFDAIEDLSTGDPARDLESVVERVEAVGERVLVADLTSPDVADLGLTVVRAVIPGFQPLHMGYPLRSLGGRRLREVPARLGQERPGLPLGDNPAPHPYP